MAKFRVLVVEDTQSWLRILPNLIKAAVRQSDEVELVAMAGFTGAWDELIPERSWDLLVCDIGLDRQDRQKLGGHLVFRAHELAIKTIVVTSNRYLSENDINGLLKDDGVRAVFLKKDFDNKKFIGAVRETLMEAEVHLPPEAVQENALPLKRLVRDCSEGRGVTWFVGAGISRQNGLPTWAEFLNELAKSAPNVQRINARIKLGQFEEVAQDIADHLPPGQFDAEIRRFYDSNVRVDRDNIVGAVTLLPELARGAVVTTNFDRLLETTFEEAGKRFEPIIYGGKAGLLSEALDNPNKTFLVKLHGDVLEPVDRILTLNEYDHFYGATDVEKIDLLEPFPYALNRLFSDRPMCFLGSSLQNDRTVRFLKRLRRQPGHKEHYAIVEEPRDDSKQRRTEFLATHAIQPIWYPPDAHELIREFLAFIRLKTTQVHA